MKIIRPQTLDVSRRLITADDGKPGGVAVWLVIPYFSGDQGTRPLPSSVKFYVCDSIHIDGAPYAGQPLPIGKPIDVSVRCANLGSATTSVLVLFWWTDPTAAFTGPNLNLVGQTSMSLSTGNVKLSPSITWTPQPGTPEHACLLVEVKSPLDTSGTFAPATDRHYAQQNVSVVSGKAGQRVMAFFNLGNTTSKRGTYVLAVADIVVSDLTLDRVIGKDTKRLKAEGFALRAPDSEGAIAKGSEIQLDLDPGEQQLIELSVTVPNTAAAGSAIVVEALQYLNDGQRHLVGGLGVIVRVI